MAARRAGAQGGRCSRRRRCGVRRRSPFVEAGGVLDPLDRARAVHERSIEAMFEEFDSVSPEAFQRRLQYLRDLEPIANEYSNRLLALPY